jgi:alanine racemase
MPRPILATIHRAALALNLAAARAHAAGAKVWAVVKANAYGHGIERVFPAFAPQADGFALLDLAEAERVRALGWQGPILLLEGPFAFEDLPVCARLGLRFALHSAAQLDWLEAYAPLHAGAPLQAYVKLNSGMNRLGFAPADYAAAWRRAAALPCCATPGHMTHFADADGARGVAEQLQCFERVTAGLPGERTLCNSAALLAHAGRVGGDWMRPGIALYGSSPFGPQREAAALGLRPTMTLSTRLIGVQHLQAGDRVGYGGSFVADRALRIGIAACGYADGYPRHAPTGTPLVVAGRPTRTLGRVSMDMLAVDLSGLPESVGIGAEVELWGRQQPIDAVAASAGTVAYELLCALAPRVPVRCDDTLG